MLMLGGWVFSICTDTVAEYAELPALYVVSTCIMNVSVCAYVTSKSITMQIAEEQVDEG